MQEISLATPPPFHYHITALFQGHFMLKKQGQLLDSLILLTALAIFSQLVYCFVVVKLGASDYTDDVTIGLLPLIAGLFRTPIVIIPILGFILTQIFIYASFIALIWYFTNNLAELFKLKERPAYFVGVFLWINAALFVLAANTYFFPQSFFAILIRYLWFHPLSELWLHIILGVTTTILLFAVLCSALIVSRHLLQKNYFRRDIIFGVFVSLMVMIVLIDTLTGKPKIVLSTATAEKPNIFIIGLDAFRPDYVNDNSPTIKNFIQSGINFSNTYTPLAQTFPAWVSILTGTHPVHNHSRGNFSDSGTIAKEDTLAKRLQKAGYETMYATDDRGVLAITPDFGFDRIIGPRMGLNNYLLGYLNDFPLTNLIIPTSIGKWLFPYSYANHMAIHTYQPQNILNLIGKNLSHRNGKPLFFAAHFNLSGWPFFYEKHVKSDVMPSVYQQDAVIADLQLKQFFKQLQQSGLLDHALVFLISDHGIALGLPGDRVTTSSLYQGNKDHIKLTQEIYSIPVKNNKKLLHIDTAYGYGMDVLSLVQMHALMGVKGYGVSLPKSHTIATNTSLMDIAPTILDFLQQPPLLSTDGISLKNALLNEKINLPSRPLYLETSTVFAVPKHVSPAEILLTQGKFFRINSANGSIYLPENIIVDLIKNKHRAILWDDWLLAELHKTTRYKYNITHHAATKTQKAYSTLQFEPYEQPPQLILVNLKTKQWTAQMDQPFAQHAPLQKLWGSFRGFYGKELAYYGKQNLLVDYGKKRLIRPTIKRNS